MTWQRYGVGDAVDAPTDPVRINQFFANQVGVRVLSGAQLSLPAYSGSSYLSAEWVRGEMVGGLQNRD